MTPSKGPSHVVVDGSNIATEGRSLPSLNQLNEAVMAFMEEYPQTSITVVVDATFGHRIDKSEAKEFEEGVSNNELVAPPAGAVGRGDAFVLAIAQKSKASILSNDSFQEFHGDYEWLFDEGRLIGGKPVPHVGWVFVDRVPVRGPVSRKATGSSRGGSRRGSKRDDDTVRTGRKASAAAMEPMPVPKSPPPGRQRTDRPEPSSADPTPVTDAVKRERAPRAGEVVNELMPFLEFVEHHPVGTSVNGTVESYSSHGAYISIGENGVRGYVPLRLMADPAPTSARKVMRIGESVTLVVVSFAPLRRSIDCAVPDMAEAAISEARAEQAAEAAAERKSTKPEPVERAKPEKDAPAARPARAKKQAAGKAAPGKRGPVAESAPAKSAPPKTAPPKSAPPKAAAAKKQAPAKAAVVKKQVPAKAAVVKKQVPAKAAATKKRAPAKAAATKKQVPAKAAAPKKQTPAKAPAAKKAPAKKAPAKRAPAKRAPAKRAQAKGAPPNAIGAVAGQGG